MEYIFNIYLVTVAASLFLNNYSGIKDYSYGKKLGKRKLKYVENLKSEHKKYLLEYDKSFFKYSFLLSLKAILPIYNLGYSYRKLMIEDVTKEYFSEIYEKMVETVNYAEDEVRKEYANQLRDIKDVNLSIPDTYKGENIYSDDFRISEKEFFELLKKSKINFEIEEKSFDEVKKLK